MEQGLAEISKISLLANYLASLLTACSTGVFVAWGVALFSTGENLSAEE